MSNSLFSLLPQWKKYLLLKQYIKILSRRLPRISNFNIYQKPVLLIHQMGKVGSTSIYQSIRTDFFHQFDIYHRPELCMEKENISA